MKIKLSSCFGWGRDQQKQEFIKLYELNKSPDFTLVESYSDADLILVTDIHHRNAFKYVLSVPQHKKYFEKLVCYTEMDFPPASIPGIYSSCSVGNQMSEGSGYYFLLKDIDSRFGQLDPELEVEEKTQYLISFMGRVCNQVRKDIMSLAGSFEGQEVTFEDSTKSFPLFHGHSGRNADLSHARTRYLQILKNSKFVICPRGAGLSSIRLFECMRVGAVPVVISDNLKLPSNLDWQEFSIFVKEKDIAKIPELIRQKEGEFETLSKIAKTAYFKFFHEEKYWTFIETALLKIVNSGHFGERTPLSLIYCKMYVRDLERNLLKFKRKLKSR